MVVPLSGHSTTASGDPSREPTRRHVAGLPTEFAEAVLDLVDRIPPGFVLTYGDVAELLGRGGPRAVGTVMSRFGSDVPWWRVIRAGGLPPQCHDGEALTRWRAEGTPLVGGPARGRRVDMAKGRWGGPDSSRSGVSVT